MNETPDSISQDVFRHRIELIREIGLMAYRFLLTLNTGGFVILLTFLGSAHENKVLSLDLPSFKCAMFAFLGSIFFVFASMTTAYLSAQLHLQNKELPGGQSMTGAMLWMIIPVTLSFVFFAYGVTLAISGFEPK